MRFANPVLIILCAAAALVSSAYADDVIYARYPLSTGVLYVPEDYSTRGNQLDLLIHFHGADDTVKTNFTRSGKAAALVVINYSGLSSAYQKPFSNSGLFGQIVVEARQKMSAREGRPLRVRRLVLSSFSAGYAAIREILKSPLYFSLVTDVVLADSLYASYATVNGHRVPDPTQMKDFVAFAKRAAQNNGTMIVTHSQLVPGTYASTIETADALIAAVGAVRVPASGVDATAMTLESKADLGRFHVRSYEGTTGDDHLMHLRGISEAFRQTSLLSR
ncbi:MAG: hypothetical protein IT209_09165 [Armatimonadetes bacterium]|nr:hypothetical protein [Armatimonadota bacterium]